MFDRGLKCGKYIFLLLQRFYGVFVSLSSLV
jgi:hypothetical protein